MNYCPVCGRRFEYEVEIHGHLGITTSNLRTDWRDSDGTLLFSYEGMMAQLRQMGYLVPAAEREGDG